MLHDIPRLDHLLLSNSDFSCRDDNLMLVLVGLPSLENMAFKLVRLFCCWHCRLAVHWEAYLSGLPALAL